jgi:hypothetical protein
MAEAKTKNELVEKDETPQLPAELMESFAGEAGAGFEDTDANDYRIPYVSIAQALTPALDKDDAQYIDGLEKGMIFDNVEGRVYEQISFIPCKFDHAFIEWIPKNKGGGFVGRHELDSGILAQTTRSDDNRDMLPNGNEIIDTRYLYVLILGEDGSFPAVISFARTGTKPIKTLMSVANNLRLQGKKGPFQPPLYSHVYTLGTVQDQNADGLKYHVWKMEGRPQVCTDAHLVMTAKDLADAITRGDRGVVEGDELAAEASGESKEPAF